MMLLPVVWACSSLAFLPQAGSPPGLQSSVGTSSIIPGLERSRVGRVVQIETPPVLDGRLDDPAWLKAEPLTGFIQRVPGEGAPASESTEIRILQDEEALWIGVWLWDSNPAGIVEGPAIRDSRLDDSDAILLVFDTFRDRQNGFVFGTNPSGIEYDGQVSDEGRGGGGMGAGGRTQGGAGGGFNLNWDGSWSVATSRDDRGWYAEFRIPFSTLRYANAEEAIWGFNAMRRVRRLNEESFWAPIPRQFDLNRVSLAGELQGLSPPVRRQATLTPYLLQSAQREHALGDDSYGFPTEVGADAKVQLTQGLTLDLTLNTDFAQVEVDDQQVNLTRFSLFFPEKRPFFLENAGAFRVGTRGTELFFSRRIGIQGGAPVPIQAGSRLSGRAGGFNVGLLHIRTGADPLLESDGVADPEGDAFSVVRLARELPNRSQVGTFFAERRGLEMDGTTNRTMAVDGQLGIGQGLTVGSFLARTETPGLEGRDHAFHLSGNYQGNRFRSFATYREVGSAFNPEVGFVNRRDYRTISGFAMTYHRPEAVTWLREYRPHISYSTFRSLETGFEQSARVHVDVHFELENGAFFSPAFDWVREGLVNPFPIAEGVIVPPGSYDGWTAAWRFNSDLSAPVSLDGGIDVGSFLSGERRGGFGTVAFRRGASATAALRLDHNRIRLPEGDFDVNLASLRTGYFFTPRIYLQSLVQYSNQVDTWSANIRFGWLDTAGTGLFVVLNSAQGHGALAGPQARSLVIKYTRHFTALEW